MGQSTDGIICFGIRVVEEAELPWDIYDGDIDAWWREEALGYESPFQIFGEDGNWLNGVEASREKVDAWYDHKREFDKANPSLPIELVMHCSGDYPMWIIADEEAGMSASRGYPKRIDVNQFYVPPERVKVIEDFVEKWGIETEGEIGWWLASLWF